MILFNLISALYIIDQDTPCQLETPAIPLKFDIFNQVFVNSLSPDISTLYKANKLLISTLYDYMTLLSPIRGYIKKLASGSERLYTQNTIH